MAIFEPADLTDAKRESIQKKQFSTPPPDDAEAFLLWQHECDVIFRSDEPIDDGSTSQEGFEMSADLEDITIDDTQITSKDFCCLVDWHIFGCELKTDNDAIANAYIGMIVEHVSQETYDAKETEGLKQAVKDAEHKGEERLRASSSKEKKRPRSPGRSRSRSPNTGKPRPIRERSPNNPYRSPAITVANQPTCKMITAESFATIMSPDDSFELIPGADVELTRMLEEIDCTPENFRNLDYLFIPVHYLNYHMLLIGIAPKQKFAFVVDSYMKVSDDPLNMWYRKGLQALLMILDPLALYTPDNTPAPSVFKARQWYIFGQYVLRTLLTDKSPEAVRQSGGYNCGAFSMTNAFCLAFGYDLLCFTEEQIDEWKKARMAFELRNGAFTGAYGYDMIKISEKDVTVAEEVSNVDPEDDLEMQFGIKESLQDPTTVLTDTEYDSDNASEGSDGEVDEIAESKGGRAFFTITQARLLGSQPVQPNPDKLPWPPQFSKTVFDRAQLLYSIPPVNFRPELKYSKRELKKACREFPLAGWKIWSKQSQPLFLEWMLNEMAATLSIRNNGPIGPACHLALDANTGPGVKRKETTHERHGSTKKRRSDPKP